MADTVHDLADVRVLELGVDGPALRGERDAVGVIEVSFAQGARWIAIPVQRFDEDVFRLSTRLAGEIIQKFVNYRRRLAIVGDLSRFLEASAALRDFVRESNQGGHVWFVASIEELAARLADRSRQSPGA